MIDINTSYTAFGTDVKNLSPSSHQNICAVCDGCGKVRVTRFLDYRELCPSCARMGNKNHNYGKNFSKEHNPMYGKKHSEETKHRMSIIRSGKHRSEETKLKLSIAHKGKRLGKNHPMYGIRGDKHPCWNSSLTNEDRHDRRLLFEYKQWAIVVKQRDQFTCQKCQDNTGGNLVSHHILGYSAHPNARFDLDNGITLCEDCHSEFHKTHGYKYFTNTDFFEWISDK